MYDIFRVNFFKSLYYNFRYLSFKQACHLPILVGYKTTLNLSGKYAIKIHSNVYYGMIKIGVNYEKSVSSKKDETFVDIYGSLELKKDANFGKGTRIVVLPKGKLFIGSSFAITGRSSFRVYRYVKIGDNCLFSWDILLMDYDGHRIYNDKGDKTNDHIPLVIGSHVWIGCRSSIWDGAYIPDNSIIGNNSNIKKKLLVPASIYIENGKMIKQNIRWER